MHCNDYTFPLAKLLQTEAKCTEKRILPPEEAADRMHLSHGEIMLAGDEEVRHTQQAIDRVQVGNRFVHSIVEGRDHCNGKQPVRLDNGRSLESSNNSPSAQSVICAKGRDYAHILLLSTDRNGCKVTWSLHFISLCRGQVASTEAVLREEEWLGSLERE